MSAALAPEASTSSVKPSSVAPNSLEGDILDLTQAYERALTAAVGETDGRRAAQAFDAADRLQHRLLQATQRLRRRACDRASSEHQRPDSTAHDARGTPRVRSGPSDFWATPHMGPAGNQ